MILSKKFRSVCVGLLAIALWGCGGAPQKEDPPPPAPDFSIRISPSQVGVAVGDTGAPISVSIEAMNGFSGPVAISFSGLPAGITVSPSEPMSLGPGQDLHFNFTAAESAIPRDTMITITGRSGSLSRSNTLQFSTLAVNRSMAALYPTTSKVEDTVYDPIGKRLFVSSLYANRVEVFATTTSERVESIPIPWPSGIDISMDGSKIYVGTLSDTIYVIDTSTLAITAKLTIPWQAVPVLSYHKVIDIGNGNLFVFTQAAAIKWNPATGEFADRFPAGVNPLAGIINIARSADYSRIVLLGGGLHVYDVLTDSYIAEGGIGCGGESLAVNPNGTQFATVLGTVAVCVWDENLNLLAVIETPHNGLKDVVYSWDGRFIYGVPDHRADGGIAVVDAQTLGVVGAIPATTGEDVITVRPRLSVDESGRIFSPLGAFNHVLHSLLVFDSTLVHDVPNVTTLNSAASLRPLVGPASEPTMTASAFPLIDGKEPTGIFFGVVSGIGLSKGTRGILNASTPASGRSEEVIAKHVYEGGWEEYLGTFTYGQLLHGFQTTVSPVSGGAAGRIVSIGFGGPDVADTATASVNGVPASISTGTTEVVIFSPPHDPGLVDLTIKAPDETFFVPRFFDYAEVLEVFPASAELEQMVYDSLRGLLYLTNPAEGKIEVFSPTTLAFLAPIPVGTNPTWASIAPDLQTLAVADPTTGTLHIVDLNARQVTKSIEFGDPSVTHSKIANVGMLSSGKAFVSFVFAGFGPSPVGIVEVDIDLGTFFERTDFPLGNVSVNRDGTRAVISGMQPTTAVWSAADDSVMSRDLLWGASICGDGTSILARFGDPRSGLIPALAVADLNLRRFSATVSRFSELYDEHGDLQIGARLHETGALIYAPYLKLSVLSEVDIFDAHTGDLRRRVLLPDMFKNGDADLLALDESGRTIFAKTQSGLTVIQLMSAPLGIGTVQPEQGPSVGGTMTTIRGSGFQSGTVAIFGDTEATSTTFVDENTLEVVTPALSSGTVYVRVRNPSGEEYSLAAAYRYLP